MELLREGNVVLIFYLEVDTYYGGVTFIEQRIVLLDNGKYPCSREYSAFLYRVRSGYLINPASNLKVYGQFIYRKH
jgi:hypothetical protein